MAPAGTDSLTQHVHTSKKKMFHAALLSALISAEGDAFAYPTRVNFTGAISLET
jgi:hypothetical protein